MERKIEREYLKESIQQDIWEILLLDSNLRCTCDDAERDTEIFQAKGHYHHCMLWQVARAIEISFRIMVDRDEFVFDKSKKFGRLQTNANQPTYGELGKGTSEELLKLSDRNKASSNES